MLENKQTVDLLVDRSSRRHPRSRFGLHKPVPTHTLVVFDHPLIVALDRHGPLRRLVGH